MMIIGVGYTLGPIILATKLTHVPGPIVVAGATSIVALGWIPWSVYHWPTHLSSETLSCVAVLSVVCTAGAFLTFFELVKEIGSTRSVVVTYVNTAIAVVLGIVGLGEPLTVGIAIGFPLVIVGSIFATSSPQTAKPLDVVASSDSNLIVNE
jgi:drug/metabolite transporter (DMT)-like permease